MKLIVPDREKLNLLGYFIEKIIMKNCNDSNKKNWSKRFSAKLLITGSSMSVLVVLNEGVIKIMPTDERIKPDVSVKADLSTFLDIALGGNLIPIYLSGKIKLKGNLIKLIPMLKWIRF